MKRAWVVVGIGAALRLVATVGITPTVYVDSIEYRGVALFGGRRRPWTVPLLHALVGDGAARVVAHAVLGAVAWGALALTLAELLRHPRVRLAAVAVVMTLGLVGPVVNHDTTITSETVAISLAVGLLAALLRLAAAPSVARAAVVVAVAVPFTFTRNDHPLLLTVPAVVAVVLAVRRRDVAVRVVAAGLVLVATWGWAAVNRNDEVARFNLALVVANRVLPDEGDTAFFADRGMPVPPPGGDAVLAMSDSPAWNRWARASGRATYARWLLANPDHLLLGPWPDLFGTRSTTLEEDARPTVLLAPADRYGRIHPVVPDPVEELLWGGRTAGPVLVAGAGLAVVAVARGRGLRGIGAAPAVAVGALVVGVAHLWVVWHASPVELGRLAMVGATLVHASLAVLVAVAVDRRLA